ncbi:MAG: DUF3467 domain-containing protein [Anaerolineales bacterium]|nr:DUF3467 domain-containing protein [Anaerolineales bacterium]
MSKKSEQPPAAGRIHIHLPPDLESTYANFAMITHSRSEIVIDFAQVLPQMPRARVLNRVVMTALNAKLLLRALSEHITRYEAQHGEIDLPEGTSLADHLFRHVPPGDSPTDDPSSEE